MTRSGAGVEEGCGVYPWIEGEGGEEELVADFTEDFLWEGEERWWHFLCEMGSNE